MPKYTTDYEKFLARRITQTKYEARVRRDIEFNIDLYHLVYLYKAQDGKCALTGWKMEFTNGYANSRTNPYVCTLDRINPDVGYIEGNVQLSCWLPNKIKNTLRNDEFINLCEAVAVCNK